MRPRVPVQVIAILAEMRKGFPFAHKVFAVATVVFIVFGFVSALASTNPLYTTWLEASQPFTDAVARFVPAVDSATSFLQSHRTFLEQHSSLYWIPTIRNVLSIDFALLLFFLCCFILALCIDLLRDLKRASNNIITVSEEFGHPIAPLLMVLLIGFLPTYLGAVSPLLMGLAGTVIFYGVVLGLSGLFMFATIYLTVCLLATKLGVSPECQGDVLPETSNENKI